MDIDNFIHDDDPPTIDDLRVLVREIDQHEQMGETDIVRRARSALLRLLRASNKRLIAKHKLARGIRKTSS